MPLSIFIYFFMWFLLVAEFCKKLFSKQKMEFWEKYSDLSSVP